MIDKLSPVLYSQLERTLMMRCGELAKLGTDSKYGQEQVAEVKDLCLALGFTEANTAWITEFRFSTKNAA